MLDFDTDQASGFLPRCITSPATFLGQEPKPWGAPSVCVRPGSHRVPHQLRIQFSGETLRPEPAPSPLHLEPRPAAVQAESGPATHLPDTESSSLDTGYCLLHRPSSAPGGHCPPGSWGHTMRKTLSAPQTLSSCHPQLLFGTKRATQAPPPLLPRSAHLEELLFLSYSVLEAVPGG